LAILWAKPLSPTSNHASTIADLLPNPGPRVPTGLADFMSPARGFVKTLADFGIGQLFGGGARHALFEPFAAKVGWGHAPSLEGAVARLNSVDDPIICDQDFAAGIAAFLIRTQVATTVLVLLMLDTSRRAGAAFGATPSLFCVTAKGDKPPKPKLSWKPG
jgi:hypothetical protein